MTQERLSGLTMISIENEILESINYEEDDEIIARIPDYDSEIKEENGNSMESVTEVESNDLDALKVLKILHS